MPLRKLLLLGLALIVLAGAAFFGVMRSQQAKGQDASVSSAKKRHPLAESMINESAARPLLLGPSDWLEAKPTNLQSTIPVSGTVKAVHAAMVKARVPGDLLVLHVREGMAVRRGDVLGQIDPRDYESRVREREAQLRAAQAQLETAERNFDANRQLVARGFLSQNTGDNARSTRDAALATRDAARFQLEQARKALEDTALVATIDGTVQERFALPGEKLSSDARVLSLVDTRDMEAEMMVPLQHLPQVRLGQTLDLTVEGVERPIQAQVMRINPGTSGSSRQVAVFMRLTSNAQIKAGSFAQGSLPAATREAVLALPLTAIRAMDQTSPFVWVVENNRLTRKSVRIGLRDIAKLAPNGARGMAEVSSGLQKGEIVVVAAFGAQEGRLQEGQAVQLDQSAVNQTGRSK